MTAQVTLGDGPAALRENVRELIALGGWTIGSDAAVAVGFPGYPMPTATTKLVIGDTYQPGVDLVYPTDNQQLLQLIDHAVADKICPVIEVRGLSGAVGTTMIAAALAWQLSAQRTVLIDAHPHCPDIAGIIGLSPTRLTPVSDTAAPLAHAAVASLPTWGKVHVLAPTRPLQPAAAQRLIHALRRDASWVVLDAGRGPGVPGASVRIGVAGRGALSTWNEQTLPLDFVIHTLPPGKPRVRLSMLQRATNAGWGPRPQRLCGIRHVAKQVRACLP